MPPCVCERNKAERITDTIMFKHKRITNPTVTAADAIVAAASELTATLKGNIKTTLANADIQELY